MERSLIKSSWWGQCDNPRVLRLPGTLFLAIFGFYLACALTVAALFTPLSRASTTLGNTVTDVRITDCYVDVTCATDWRIPLSISIDESGTNMVIDGSASAKCEIQLCVQEEDRKREAYEAYLAASAASNASGALLTLADFVPPVLTFNLNNAVLHVGSSFESPLEVKSDTASKVFLGPGSFTDVLVNISRGIVVLTDVVSPAVSAIVDYGPVILSHSFEPRVLPGSPSVTVPVNPFIVDAEVSNNAYCVAQKMTTLTPGTCVSTSAFDVLTNQTVEILRCPLYASFLPNGTTNASHFSVSASSLYVNDRGNYTNEAIPQEELLSNETDPDAARIAGEGMFVPPRVDPLILVQLNDTANWRLESTLPNYVQSIDVMTPTFGIMILHTDRRIVFELGPEYLAFYTMYALRPFTRSFVSVLDHYRCPANQAQEYLMAQSLTAPIDSASGTTELTPGQIEMLLENQFARGDQLEVSQQVFEAVGDRYSTVAFTSPELEWVSPGSSSSSVAWRLYELVPGVNGTAFYKQLKPSGLVTALIALSNCTSLLVVIAIIASLIFYSKPAISFFLSLHERELYRSATGYEKPVPYHCFVGVLSLVSWITFRIALIIAAKVRPPLFKVFLERYMKQSADQSAEDARQAEKSALVKATKSTPYEILMARFERFALLRMSSADGMTREDAVKVLSEVGGRQLMQNRNMALGLVRRPSVRPAAKFVLEFSSLSTFYDVTRAARDSVLVDELYQRLIIEDTSITKDQLLLKLRQWRFDLVSRSVPVILEIQPKEFTKQCLITPGELRRVVEELEAQNAAIPTYGSLVGNTLGPCSGGKKFAITYGIGLVEVLATSIMTFLPFVFAFLSTSILTIEHEKYSTTTYALGMTEIRASFNTIGEPRPRNALTMATVIVFFMYACLAMLEPWIILLTYRIAATYSSERFRFRDILLALRYFFFLPLTLLSLLVAIIYCLWYICTVGIWWVLGAIIAPTHMLAFAASVFAVIFLVVTTIQQLTTMRKLAMKRLEDKILEELLNLIRNSPAGEMFDKIEDAASSSKGGLAGGGANIEITAGLLLDVISSDQQLSMAAIDKLCVALNVPSVIVKLMMALMQPQPQTVRAMVEECLQELEIPTQLHDVVAQLCFRVLDFPTRSAELAHAFYEFVPEYKDKLMAQDDTIVALTQAALMDNVDLPGLIRIGMSVGMSKVSKLLGVSQLLMQQIFSAAHLAATGEAKGAVVEAINILTFLRPRIPKNPTVLRPLFNCVVEGLKMANDGEHKLREAVLDLMQSTGLKDTVQSKILAPIIAGSKAAEAAGSRVTSLIPGQSGGPAASGQGGNAGKASKLATELIARVPGQPTVGNGGEQGGVEMGTQIARLVAGLIENKFALGDQQRDSFDLLAELVGGDLETLRQMDSRFLPATEAPYKLMIRALDMFDNMIEGWQHLAVVVRELLVAAQQQGAASQKRMTELLQHAASLHGLAQALETADAEHLFEDVQDEQRRRVIIDRAKKVHQMFEPILVRAAEQQDEDSPPVVLEMWLLDQWAGIGSLLGLRLGDGELPPAMCKYKILEGFVDIPADALRVIRMLSRSVMMIVRQVFGQLADLHQLHADLMAKFEESKTLEPDCLDDAHPIVKKIFPVAEEAIRALMGHIFPPDFEFECSPNMLRSFTAKLRARIIREAQGLNVDVVAQLATDASSAQKQALLDAAGGGGDPLFSLASGEDAEGLAEEAMEQGLQESGLVKIPMFGGSEGREFRKALHEAIFAVLTELSRAAMEGRKVDLGELKGSLKAVVMTLLQADQFDFLDDLVGRGNQVKADFLDDLVDFFITNAPFNLFSSEAHTEAKDALDISNLARLLQVPKTAIKLFINPDEVVSKYPELGCLPMILRIVRGEPIERVMTPDVIKSQLRPLLRQAGVNDEDFANIDDRIRFCTHQGISRSRAEDVIGSVLGQAADMAKDGAKEQVKKATGLEVTEERLKQLKDAFLNTMELRASCKDLSLIRTCQYVYSHREAKAMVDAAAKGVTGHGLSALKVKAANGRAKVYEAAKGFDERTREERDAAIKVAAQFGRIVDEVIEACFFGFSLLKFWKNTFRRVRECASAAEGRDLAKRATSKLLTLMPLVTPFLFARLQKLVAAHSKDKTDPRLPVELHCVKLLLEQMRKHPVVADFDTGTRRLKTNTMPSAEELGGMSAKEWAKMYGDVNNGETAVNLDLIFANISPFMLLCEEVPEPARNLFGLLFGITEFYPRDMPQVVCALITCFVRKKSTPRAVLGIVASQFPIKKREFVMELAAIACGNLNQGLMACGTAAGLSGELLGKVRQLFVPREAVPLDPMRLISHDEDSGKHYVMPPQPNWLAMIASIASGDVYSILKWQSFFPFDTPCLAMALTHPSRPRLQQLLLTMFPENEKLKLIAKTRANALEAANNLKKTAQERAAADARQAIGQYFPQLNALIEQSTPHLKRGYYLVTGMLMMYQCKFDEAAKAFEQFAGDDLRELTAVRIGTLAARLVIEEGAVNDRDAVLSAVGAALHCLPMLDKNLEAAVRLAASGVSVNRFSSITNKIKKATSSLKKKAFAAAAKAKKTAEEAAESAAEATADALAAAAREDGQEDGEELDASIRAFKTASAGGGGAMSVSFDGDTPDPTAVGEQLLQMVTIVLPFLINRLPALMHTPTPILPAHVHSPLQDLAERMQREVEEMVDTAKAEAEKVVDEAKEQAEKAAEEAKKRAAEEAEKLKQQAEAELRKRRAELEERIAEERAKVDKKVEDLKREAEQKIEEAKEEARKKAEEAKDDVEARVNEAKKDGEEQLSNAIGQAQASLEDLQGLLAEVDQKLNELRTGFADVLPGANDDDSETGGGVSKILQQTSAAAGKAADDLDELDDDDDDSDDQEDEDAFDEDVFSDVEGAAALPGAVRQAGAKASSKAYQFVKRLPMKARLLDGAQEHVMSAKKLAEQDESESAMKMAKQRARQLGKLGVNDIGTAIKVARTMIPMLMPADSTVHPLIVSEVLDVVEACLTGIRDLVASPKLSTAVDVLLKIVVEAEEAVEAAKQLELIERTVGSTASKASAKMLESLKAKRDSGKLQGTLANVRPEMEGLADAVKEILQASDSGPKLFLGLLKKVADLQARVAAQQMMDKQEQVKRRIAAAGGSDDDEEFPMPPAAGDAASAVLGGVRPSTAMIETAKKYRVPNITIKVHISPYILNAAQLMFQLSKGDAEALPELFQLFGVDVSPGAINKFRATMRAIAALRDSSGSRDLADGAKMAAQDLLRTVAESIFNEIDADRSGLMSFTEFKVALERLHIAVPEHEAQLIFKELDEDGSGQLSLDEFQTAIKNIRQRYLQRMLTFLGLTNEAIYVTIVWLIVFLIFFLLFLLIGFLGFKDGSAFTSSITALMPLMGAVSSGAKDTVNMARRLFDKVDDAVNAFFEALSETKVDVETD